MPPGLSSRPERLIACFPLGKGVKQQQQRPHHPPTPPGGLQLATSATALGITFHSGVAPATVDWAPRLVRVGRESVSAIHPLGTPAPLYLWPRFWHRRVRRQPTGPLTTRFPFQRHQQQPGAPVVPVVPVSWSLAESVHSRASRPTMLVDHLPSAVRHPTRCSLRHVSKLPTLPKQSQSNQCPRPFASRPAHAIFPGQPSGFGQRQ
jgi:hypothetical protein